MFELERRQRHTKIPPATSAKDVVEELAGYALARPLFEAASAALRLDYLAKLMSFQMQNIWEGDGKKGFSHRAELQYGHALRDHWHGCAGSLLEALLDRKFLHPPHAEIGGGLMTTIHSAGLMSAWAYANGRRESVVVRIEIEREPGSSLIRHRFVCERAIDGLAPERCGTAEVICLDNLLSLSVNGADETDLGPSNSRRRNTLAAGDVVRGALAFGLWSYGFRPSGVLVPYDVSTVLMASAVLATVKCYAGSFIDFLRVVETLRRRPIWRKLWGAV